MRSILSIAAVAGAALLVTACGGGAANNTANAPVVDNGTAMSNDMMAPTDMNGGMPADTNTMTNTSVAGNGTTTTTTTTTTNTSNAM